MIVRRRSAGSSKSQILAQMETIAANTVVGHRR